MQYNPHGPNGPLQPRGIDQVELITAGAQQLAGLSGFPDTLLGQINVGSAGETVL